MEELQMSEQSKQEWTKKFFTEAEMKEFSDIGKNDTPETMKACQDRWTALIDEIKENLPADPAGPIAQDLARRWKELLNEAYGGHPELKQNIGRAYEHAWKTGDDFSGHMPFGPEIWDFIKKARQAAGTSCAEPSKKARG